MTRIINHLSQQDPIAQLGAGRKGLFPLKMKTNPSSDKTILQILKSETKILVNCVLKNCPVVDKAADCAQRQELSLTLFICTQRGGSRISMTEAYPKGWPCVIRGIFAENRMKMKKIGSRGRTRPTFVYVDPPLTWTHISHEPSFLGWCIEFDLSKVNILRKQEV